MTRTSLKFASRFVSLRIKLLVGFTVVMGTVYGGAYPWFYEFTMSRSMQRMQEDLVGTLEGAIAGVNGDEFTTLTQIKVPPGQENPTINPLYQAHQEWMRRIHLIEHRAVCYTFIKGQKPYEVLWIGDVLRIIPSTRSTFFRESYIADPAKTPLYQGLTKTTVITDPYADEWGNWISAFGPIKNSKGTIVGAVGIDFQADTLFEVQRSVRNGMLLSFGLVYGTLFTLIYIVTGVMTRPLKKLQTIAKRIGQGDYEQNLSSLHQRILPDETGILAGIFAEMVNNVRTRERQLTETRTERDRFFNYSIDLMAIADLECRIQQVNPAWESIFGYHSEALEGEWLLNFVHPEDVEATQICWQKLTAEQRTGNFEHRWRAASGEYHWLSWNWVAIPAEAKSYGFARDISERKRSEAERKQTEERLLYSAFYDSLTTLPNRAYFMEHLQTALHHAQHQKGKSFAVIFIDLDQFKVVNDSLGHLAGDQLLTQVGGHLRQCIRSHDTVARLGGDEFAMLIEDIHTSEEAILVAERVQTQLSQPFRFERQEFMMSASIGITFSHNQVTGKPYDSPTDLLRDADIAMYRAKQRGKDCYAIFDHWMHTSLVNRLSLETDLRRAVERSELFLCYQPILSLHSGRLRGFEALLRWNHSEKGFISPAEFIPIAEETGLIVPIGLWVLKNACQQLSQWRSQGLLRGDVNISINVAGRQFAQGNLVRQIQQILHETTLPAENLCLEVTESAISENLELVVVQLNQLQALGIQISIDDFGTGHSSLSRLQSLPVNTVKVDRSFIQAMEQQERNQKFVRAIVTFAHSLGMSVVAEGIETVGQHFMLQDFCSEYGQGYLFAKPLKGEDVGNWLTTHYGTPEIFYR